MSYEEEDTCIRFKGCACTHIGNTLESPRTGGGYMSYEEEDTCTTSRVAPVHTLGTP
jgi:hypothetical protein